MTSQLRHSLRIAPILVVLAATCAGCPPGPRDISADPQIRDSGVIGSAWRLGRDVPLVEVGRPYPRLVLGEPPVQPQQGGPGRTLGVVRAGTRLRIVRVERATTYWDGMFAALEQ